MKIRVITFLLCLLPSICQAGYRFALATDIHYNAYNFNDLTSAQRVALLVEKLNAEHAAYPLDFVVILGDTVNDEPNDLATVKAILDDLTPTYYMVHGGHDACPEATWAALFGYAREYTFTLDDYAFVVLNNFATEAGPPYTASCTDNTWLSNTLAGYVLKRGIFVFTHSLDRTTCTDNASTLAATGNLLGVFSGHTHLAAADLVSNRYAVTCGHWSVIAGAEWDNDYPYGYQIIEISDDNEVTSYHRYPGYVYSWGTKTETDALNITCMNGCSCSE